MTVFAFFSLCVFFSVSSVPLWFVYYIARRFYTVIMQEPEPTPFDLYWRMFGVPVRVHPMFWVLAACLGWGYFNGGGGIRYLLLWIGCVFVSILLHEMSHVLTGRVFGSNGHVLLFWFGGLAIGSSDLPRRWQRILVYLAGPLSQLALAGILLLSVPEDWIEPVGITLRMLLWINLFWAFFNLLPIWPLDGGQVTREVCEVLVPGRGGMFALWASTIFCGVVAVLIWLGTVKQIPPIPWIDSNMYNAFLFAMFSGNSYQALQTEKLRRSWNDRLPWER